MKIGSIEAGGTKMVCAIGSETGRIYEKTSIPTMAPDITVPEMIKFFKDKGIEALGIGCFGPVCLNREDPQYGCITSTPKTEWRSFPMVDTFKNEFNVPVGFDTDVNAACLGEAMFGAAKGLNNVVYLTVGTGIGAGIIVEGKLLHGNLHPEAGHITLRRHPSDRYEGKCPFHQDCFEGLAAGPAIEERWHRPARELSDNKAVWEMEAFYISQALTNYILILAPQKIILGGGVMHQEQLFPLVRRYTRETLAGYLETPEIADIDNYIVPAQLKDAQGIIGGICLGKEAYGACH